VIPPGLLILRRLSTLTLPLSDNKTSIRLRYSGISSRFGLSRPARLRERGLYLLKPGTLRERASEADAVIRLEWVCCAVRGVEEEAGNERMKGSKCSLRRSDSGLFWRDPRISGVGLRGLRFIRKDVLGFLMLLANRMLSVSSVCLLDTMRRHKLQISENKIRSDHGLGSHEENCRFQCTVEGK